MSNTNVKNYASVQNVTKNISNKYSYVQKSSANMLDKTFGNLMKNSMNKLQNQTDTKGIQEKMLTRRSQVEYIVRGAKHTGDGKAVDESTMTGSLKALTSEVKAVVCAVLDVTDEELERMLAESGMGLMDLLSQNNLADFISQALADGDTLKLLTDSNISETFTQLSDNLQNLLTDCADELGVSTDEVIKYTQLISTEDNDAPVDFKTADDKLAPAFEAAEEPAVVNEKVNTENVEATDNSNANAEIKLEDKITVETDESSAHSETSGNENQSLSSQFLESLIGNVDNAIGTGAASESNFAGYSVKSEDIVRQLVDAIKVNVNSTFSEMELQLQPENLGKLNLVISSRDGIITAQLMAENDDVKNAIENQLVMLKDNFEQQGLKVDAVEVTVQSHGFETGKNLEGRNENQQDDGGHKSPRQLTLEEINAIIGDDEATEEDVLAAEMLRATGGNVDYMI
jgi:flagellar hook-length control protein FliK